MIKSKLSQDFFKESVKSHIIYAWETKKDSGREAQHRN